LKRGDKKNLKLIYVCPVCGWTGTEEEIEWGGGYLWDYTGFEMCPKCWDEELEQVPLDVKYTD